MRNTYAKKSCRVKISSFDFLFLLKETPLKDLNLAPEGLEKLLLWKVEHFQKLLSQKFYWEQPE